MAFPPHLDDRSFGGDRQEIAISDIDIIADPNQSDEELFALDDALIQFQAEDPEKPELVRLRYFAGLTEEEVAHTLNISRATASRWWTYSKAWLLVKVRGELGWLELRITPAFGERCGVSPPVHRDSSGTTKHANHNVPAS